MAIGSFYRAASPGAAAAAAATRAPATAFATFKRLQGAPSLADMIVQYDCGARAHYQCITVAPELVLYCRAHVDAKKLYSGATTSGADQISSHL